MSDERPFYYRFEHHPEPVRLHFPPPKRRYLTDQEVVQIRRELADEFGKSYRGTGSTAAQTPLPREASEPELPLDALVPASPVPADALPGDPLTAEQKVRLDRSQWRYTCDWFELFRLCGQARCRHASRCRGEPMRCLRAGVRHAPKSARNFVLQMLEAQRLRLSFEEAFDDAADDHDGYFAWIAGLRATHGVGAISRRRRRA